MTTEEKLEKIMDKCRAFLKLAEKRTPGEWALFHQQGERPGIEGGDTSIVIIGQEDDFTDDGGVRGRDDVEAIHNAIFIASCAGLSEAMARSTIAAIEGWMNLYHAVDSCADGAPDASEHDKLCNELVHTSKSNINHIIAAFPDEIL